MSYVDGGHVSLQPALSLTVRRASSFREATVDVEIELGDPVVVRVTDVHPVALADAISHALDAALRLNRELRPTDAD